MRKKRQGQRIGRVWRVEEKNAEGEKEWGRRGRARNEEKEETDERKGGRRGKARIEEG
jgi:hypothetical protein